MERMISVVSKCGAYCDSSGRWKKLISYGVVFHASIKRSKQ